jgi:hypothetical protein
MEHRMNQFPTRNWGAPRGKILLFLTLSAALLSGADPTEPNDPTATFFMGRIKYSNNNGNDCGTVGRELMSLV